MLKVSFSFFILLIILRGRSDLTIFRVEKKPTYHANNIKVILSADGMKLECVECSFECIYNNAKFTFELFANHESSRSITVVKTRKKSS